MKKSNKKRPKFLNDMKIEIKQKLELKNILHTALDKYTVKDLLEYMLFNVMFDGLTYGMTMMRLLAQKRDVEKVKSMVLLKYMLDNWDKKDFSKKAAEHFGKFMKKAEQKRRKVVETEECQRPRYAKRRIVMSKKRSK